MKITLNKQFVTREELDDTIRTTFGEDVNQNKDIVLEMSDEEMKKLSLSESTTVYGIKVRKIK